MLSKRIGIFVRACVVCIMYMYSISSEEFVLFFSESCSYVYWNVIMYKTFPIYHSFKEKSFYRNVNSYGFSESLYDAPCIHYFYLQTQYEFPFLRVPPVSRTIKQLYLAQRWLCDGGGPGKLDSHMWRMSTSVVVVIFREFRSRDGGCRRSSAFPKRIYSRK